MEQIPPYEHIMQTLLYYWQRKGADHIEKYCSGKLAQFNSVIVLPVSVVVSAEIVKKHYFRSKPLMSTSSGKGADYIEKYCSRKLALSNGIVFHVFAVVSAEINRSHNFRSASTTMVISDVKKSKREIVSGSI